LACVDCIHILDSMLYFVRTRSERRLEMTWLLNPTATINDATKDLLLFPKSRLQYGICEC
jgi:hypothetical protein